MRRSTGRNTATCPTCFDHSAVSSRRSNNEKRRCGSVSKRSLKIDAGTLSTDTQRQALMSDKAGIGVGVECDSVNTGLVGGIELIALPGVGIARGVIVIQIERGI